MNYKKAFYSKLEDCYLGVKIKDFHQGNIAKSGFSNLLKIKEQYFAHIKAYLESQIESEPLSHDIYNKLFTFFDSYLNESGTPFFTDTPIYKNIYAKVYTNSKDTSLFYKTQNLYYVKSDILYQSLTLSDEKQTYEVVFDASEYKQNADNTKNKIIFKFEGVESINGETNDEGKAQILIKVSNQKDLFPNLNNVFKQNSNEFSEEFLKELKQNEILKDSKIKINEEELKKIFRSYKKQSEIDFFIHKNATAFLQEQFDLWMFHYLYQESTIQEWNPEIIAHLQKIKNIAYEVIRLIGDFENELKAVWLKPKFAKKVEYVFSLDVVLNQIAQSANLRGVVGVGGEFERGEGATSQFKPLPSLIKEFLGLITNDKGFESQIKEWQELNLIDESFKKEDLLSNDKYRYLPIDTKHFSKETKYKLLSSFENLESLLNGELIKADNFQALNTLMPKYQGQVDLIYIDPPFNLGENASFDYKVNFKDSTWASLLDSRLELARNILSNKGSIFVRCDYNGNFIVRNLLNNIFGEDNFINEIIVNKSNRIKTEGVKYPSWHDSIYFYSKYNNFIFYHLSQKRKEQNWRQIDNRGEAYSKIPLELLHLHLKENVKYNDKNQPIARSKIILGQEVLPPSGRRFPTQEKILELEKEGKIRFNENGTPQMLNSENIFLTDTWTDIFGYDSLWCFQTENSEILLQRIIETSSNKNSIILDYHLGSGTTLAVAQKLGRKWLGVEMGEHFYNVIIPRLKKVIAGFQSGISKECDYKGGGAFRYYELESYEEALSHCEYVLKDSCHSEPALAGEESHRLEQHELYKGKDYAKAEAILDYRKSRKLIDRLHKGEIVCLDMSTEYRQDFDIFQTIANLMGWKIKRLFLDSKDIESCEFDNGEILNLNSLDLAKYPKLKNLIWWG